MNYDVRTDELLHQLLAYNSAVVDGIGSERILSLDLRELIARINSLYSKRRKTEAQTNPSDTASWKSSKGWLCEGLNPLD